MKLTVLSLLFEQASRPDMRAIAGLAEKSGEFSLGHYPVERARRDWVELVINGLTFDLRGLAPGDPEAFDPHSHPARFGLPQDGLPEQAEALVLVPGPHLAGGEELAPVIRSQMWLGLHLARLPGLAAIGWAGAGSLSAPAPFSKAMEEWLRGGAYPEDLLGE